MNSSSMEISFCCHCDSHKVIAINFCKKCCVLVDSDWIAARRSFHRIWIYCQQKSLLNRAHRIIVLMWTTQIAKFMGPTWGPPGSCRPQMGSMLAQWTLLSGKPNQTKPNHNNAQTLFMIIEMYIYIYKSLSKRINSIDSHLKGLSLYKKSIEPAPWWHHQMVPFSTLLALCEGIHRSRWMLLTKAIDAEL